MSYCIYEKDSTLFLRVLRNGYWRNAIYKTESGAKAALTRLNKSYPKVDVRNLRIAELGHFHKNIEKWETKRNLLSGKEFKQPVNTPMSCDPSTETYHSM